MSELSENWHLIQTEAGQFTVPSELHNISGWLPAIVPGTVAQSLEFNGCWNVGRRLNFDDFDYWYKTSFKQSEINIVAYLNFAGLASIAEVWLNNEKILDSENMFVAHHIDVTQLIQEVNELHICFRSLNRTLSKRKPRPRWKTKLVEHQQLRWLRTTLLGRIPGWTPPVAPVGPWRSISIQSALHLHNLSLRTSVKDNVGTVSINGQLLGELSDDIEVIVKIDGQEVRLNCKKSSAASALIDGQLLINKPELWWPHTHGEPRLYPASLIITANGDSEELPLTPLGFKSVELDTANDNFRIRVNGSEIFCRGACWTVNDIVSLAGDQDILRHTLMLMRDAGANMIRIGGTMVYEQDKFYQLCDELGIMVWQDFMFANMDYPFDDEEFRVSVDTEIEQQLQRLSRFVCIAVYCGSSEIEQQAAMLGMSKELWTATFFLEGLPGLCRAHHAGVPYITSTPTNGALPFHTSKGLTHYYGVGAYLRPVSELRSHDVRFTSETLGFANVPVVTTRNSVLNGQLPVTHHPEWKERVPRDSGAGWDFEDVRDHYLSELYKVNPVKLRCFESERYMRLSEIVSGEIMSQVFAEWRSSYSQCRGGLVWFLKDFLPGAGWGIIDGNNLPKACYYYLKRSWKPVQICLTNETLNGVHIHVINESSKNFAGRLSLRLIDRLNNVIANKSVDVLVESGSIVSHESDSLFDGFYDVTYTYRFGPPKHMMIVASLDSENAEHIDTAYYFPDHNQALSIKNALIETQLIKLDEDNYLLKLSTDEFLYAVQIDVKGFHPEDNYFHMIAGEERQILMTRVYKSISKCKGYLGALNINTEVKI